MELIMHSCCCVVTSLLLLLPVLVWPTSSAQVAHGSGHLTCRLSSADGLYQSAHFPDYFPHKVEKGLLQVLIQGSVVTTRLQMGRVRNWEQHKSFFLLTTNSPPGGKEMAHQKEVLIFFFCLCHLRSLF